MTTSYYKTVTFRPPYRSAFFGNVQIHLRFDQGTHDKMQEKYGDMIYDYEMKRIDSLQVEREYVYCIHVLKAMFETRDEMKTLDLPSFGTAEKQKGFAMCVDVVCRVIVWASSYRSFELPNPSESFLKPLVGDLLDCDVPRTKWVAAELVFGFGVHDDLVTDFRDAFYHHILHTQNEDEHTHVMHLYLQSMGFVYRFYRDKPNRALYDSLIVEMKKERGIMDIYVPDADPDREVLTQMRFLNEMARVLLDKRRDAFHRSACKLVLDAMEIVCKNNEWCEELPFIRELIMHYDTDVWYGCCACFLPSSYPFTLYFMSLQHTQSSAKVHPIS